MANILQKGTVTIANGASLSGALDTKGMTVVGFEMSAAWTAAGLSFQGSDDNSTFGNVYDSAGEVTIASASVVASGRLIIDATRLVGMGRYIKVRSGTAGTPVNQGAARTLGILIRPV